MTTKARLTAEASDAGARLDVFLAARLDGVTRSAAARIIADGGVIRLPRPLATAAKSCRVAEGDVFEVDLPQPEPSRAAAQDIALDVVFEDSDVIVVNKPRGMVVHPAPGHSEGTLVNALLHHCGDSLSGIGGVTRPGVVHRLDRDTSGLIIAAKNDYAHIKLAAQLRNRTLGRVYEAVARGVIRDGAGVVDAPIGRHPTHRKKQAVTGGKKPIRGGEQAGTGGKNPTRGEEQAGTGNKNSREARTLYEVIARYPGYTHVRCVLETGRTHQIRVHLAHIGHPVVGDALYGGQDARFYKLGGQCLHARKISFTHPRTGESVELSADLPAYFTDVLSLLENL